MKAQNEGAAKLVSIASAFTHVAGTFLKNYLKMTKQQHPRSALQKRRREEPPPPPLVEDVWIRPPTPAAAYFTPTPPPPPQVFVSTPSTDTDTDQGIVDLQPASFLRWPPTVPEPPPTTAATMEEEAFNIDLEALMAEPGGFQMQMAQAAAVRGPLEFDWFSWDGQFGL
jgi:hypothetical protein